MIISFEGKMGSGMSLSAVLLAYAELQMKRRVICNYHLDSKYEMMDMETLIKEVEKLEREKK
jgi:hypothetical protein